jgi:hypothetical protein
MASSSSSSGSGSSSGTAFAVDSGSSALRGGRISKKIHTSGVIRPFLETVVASVPALIPQSLYEALRKIPESQMIAPLGSPVAFMEYRQGHLAYVDADGLKTTDSPIITTTCNGWKKNRRMKVLGIVLGDANEKTDGKIINTNVQVQIRGTSTIVNHSDSRIERNDYIRFLHQPLHVVNAGRKEPGMIQDGIAPDMFRPTLVSRKSSDTISAIRMVQDKIIAVFGRRPRADGTDSFTHTDIVNEAKSVASAFDADDDMSNPLVVYGIWFAIQQACIRSLTNAATTFFSQSRDRIFNVPDITLIGSLFSQLSSLSYDSMVRYDRSLSFDNKHFDLAPMFKTVSELKSEADRKTDISSIGSRAQVVLDISDFDGSAVPGARDHSDLWNEARTGVHVFMNQLSEMLKSIFIESSKQLSVWQRAYDDYIDSTVFAIAQSSAAPGEPMWILLP